MNRVFFFFMGNPLFQEKLRVCFVFVFENCFLFLKTRRIRKKTRRTCLVPFFFFVMKNTENLENTKFIEEKWFSKNTKMMFSVFSKFVLKNSFQK